MCRNFGIGTRDLASAGAEWLQKAANQKAIGFGTSAAAASRWRQFATFVKANGVGAMEKITPELVIKYGEHIKARLASGTLTVKTAHNMISAINTTMAASPAKWTPVNPRGDCQLPARTFVRTVAPGGLDAAKVAAARAQMDPRGSELVSVARALGLRSKEASLLDAKKALKEAETKGFLCVSTGTKGGRPRLVPITNPSQVAALRSAATVQGKGRNLMPADSSFRAWRTDLTKIRNTLKSQTGHGLHDLRAAYACDRYRQLTGHDAPVVAGRMVASRAADMAARQTIAAELGHGRIDVTAAYLGGR